MAGIIFPRDWQELYHSHINILPQNNSEEHPTNTFELERKIQKALIKASLAMKDNPIGLALSGGLDSSILATVLHQLELPFQAITIADDSNHPDVVHAKVLARQLGFSHTVIILQKTNDYDNYWYLFNAFRQTGLHHVVCGDTIDELLGGYYAHTQSLSDGTIKDCFQTIWKNLFTNHLSPLDKYSKEHGISVALPFLELLDFLITIPINQRVYHSKRKVILLELGYRITLPKVILQRKKLGLCSAI
ncbi:hypothetical protein HN858_04595 [Candidatus Falkowbacteria bacterium]|jgi:asparagine synthetase B (glutamine-hydrolysing)|nr:hypothetical protein [Candidatus Falkowbacteria bacterium]MBT5503863.1 hypothetical protein [Candidatus Falkowbacteria bacterium]MBT6574406.1 hypothetical protein [Candidatus Falkowbacteria bacterium]MBT7348923.1 hypothetical protein [Candidatus Falkowbacteria bacterium]MBT7501279.1 hypothetical protein [Candidatus Falkowbacteria bacterium]